MQKTFKQTNKQTQAIAMMGDKIEVLLEGGARAGKSYIAVWAIIYRALRNPGTRHLVCRLRFNHVKLSMFYGTIKEVMRLSFPQINYKENRTDWFIEVDDNAGGEPSQIWIGGLDDKDRTEKILGNEYASIYINEASQIAFGGYEILKTRLNPPKKVKPLLIIDYNPPSTNHWGYKIFRLGVDPVTGNPLRSPQRYGLVKMNPQDNIENLSEGYLETLEDMSEAKRRRFLLGEYTDGAEGALWQRDWIANNRKANNPDLMQLVVGVDPAVTGTETSDSTGIIVAGKDVEGHYYILGDHTFRGGVTGWGQEVANIYDRYHADYVVAEVNQGGDLVESNIRQYNKNIPVKQVRATRGKAIRAEPVADLYRRGMVHHVGEFMDLEYQLTHWTPEDRESPDEMDALVWAISHLMQRDTGGPIKFIRG